MAKSCVTCGRGAVRANHRSHSKIATPRRQGVNLQSRAVDGLRVKICTSCLKTSAKSAAK